MGVDVKVAILGEESGIIRDAFLKLGHNAISCDLKPTSSLGPHLQGNMFLYDWSWCDLIIVHPDCTWMALSGNRYYAGTVKRQFAADSIWKCWNLPCEKLALENPLGQINTYLPEMPKPQYIQPWQFGHGETKKTGLWKRGLPDLIPTNIVTGREQRIWKMGPAENRSELRSKTYQGIADAMAAQWGTI